MSTIADKESPKDLIEYQRKITEKLSQKNIHQAINIPVISNDEVWVFPSASILKVSGSSKISFVPSADKSIAGVISLDGVIYTVLDFNILLGKDPIFKNITSRILFLDHESEDVAVAILVQRVLDLNSGPFLIKKNEPPLSKYSLGEATIDNGEDIFHMVNVRALFSQKFHCD